MARASFGRQFIALMKRNFIIKKRNKKHTLQEILMPIYYIVILALIRYFTSPETKPAILDFPEHNIATEQRFYPDFNKTLLVTPNTSEVESVIKTALELLAYNDTASGGNTSILVPSFELFATVADSEASYNSSFSEMGIDFSDGMLQDIRYTIRMPHYLIPSTDAEDGLYGGQGTCRTGDIDACLPTNYYLIKGVMMMQKALDTALIRRAVGQNVSVPSVRVQQMPKDSWTPNVSFIQILSAIYFVFAYSPFVNYMVVNLVTEKEKKIKEGMRMMGMRDSAFWASWGATYAIIITVVTAIIILIAFVSSFLQNSSFFILFLILLEYGLTILSMSFAISTFFSKAENGGGLASLATMVFSLLYLPISLTRTYGPGGPVSTIPVGGQWALCLISPVALALAIDQAIYLDIAVNGMNWDTLTYGQFPLYASMVMLLVDFVLYGLLAVYLDNVVPGEYGQQRPPYYFLQPSYWCPTAHCEPSDAIPLAFSNGAAQPGAAYGSMEGGRALIEEPVSQDLSDKKKLRIHNIKKVFQSKMEKKSKVVAVDGISLDLYEGHITCLLGHNGAGKTTLINMLTGMVPTTSGYATVYGYDVSDPNQMNQIRGMTGVCPQHNILLDCLTAAEHLEFFGGLKGLTGDYLKLQIKQSLKDIDLSDQADTLARRLSGGQKRKLCVAIALIGDPKVIFLDEPTAGMDPYSRRHLWTLLKERRHNKVILLTTHFMDEADILSDRKAFISKGKLQCVGSSLFLKNRFGVGYHLNMVVESGHTEAIEAMIAEHIAEVKLDRIHGKEFHFTIPLTAVSKFSVLFKDLDTRGSSFGITSYGVSMTSLEEVFLKLGIEEEAREEDADDSDLVSPLGSPDHNAPLLQQNNSGRPTSVVHPRSVAVNLSRDNSISPVSEDAPSQNKNTDQNSHTVIVDGSQPSKSSTLPASMSGKSAGLIPSVSYISGKELASQRFWAMVKVRFILAFRNKLILFFRLVLPVVFVLVGAAVNKFSSTGANVDPEVASLHLWAGLYSYVDPGATHNPDMTYKLTDPPSGTNSSDFINAISAQNIKLKDISGVSSSDLFTSAPYHVGVNVYDVSVSTDVYNLTAMYNDTARHSLPVIMNVISNAILGMMLGSTNISTYIKPWPYTPEIQLQFNNAIFSSVILLGLAMSTIPAGFGMNIVRERELKIRSQLRISGASMNLYWTATFFVDFSFFFFAVAASIIIVYAFQLEALMYAGAAVALILVYLFYMPVNTFLSYALSFLFDKLESAQAALFNIFFLLSFIPFMAVSMADMNGAYRVAEIIHYVLTVIDPPYAAFGGLYYIFRVYLIESIIQAPNVPVIPFGAYFTWDSKIPITLIAPLVHAVWLFFLIRILEVKKTGGAIKDAFCFGAGNRVQGDIPSENTDVDVDEDEDIQAERHAVRQFNKNLASSTEAPVLLVENLRKEFTKTNSTMDGCGKKKEEKVKVAVKNNTFCVSAGEVFGLLGPNGAGKTTALNMIIAEEGPTKGRVVVAGYDIQSSLSDAFQVMGYCPQHDALWEYLTLREHLRLYCLLRGITKEDAEILAQYFIDALQIEEHAKKISKKLSGGTKRKLSYAISMIGEAQVVLMDEPSTGMDPKSKRFMWDTISDSFSDSPRGAILTTHYMEEADALCSRVAIMVNGQMECIGSTQHLKNKYGSGYILEVKLNQQHQQQEQHQSTTTEAERDSKATPSAEAASVTPSDDPQMAALDAFVRGLFGNPVLTECFGDRAMYAVPQDEVQSLGDVFSALEQGKEKYNIEEYSFSQSSLEQVFLEFAKHQVEQGAEENDDEKTSKAGELVRRKSLMRQQSSQQRSPTSHGHGAAEGTGSSEHGDHTKM